MVNIEKQRVKAYILLESLAGLAVLSIIASLVLTAISTNRQQLSAYQQKEEVLSVAQMALQTGQSRVTLNGIQIEVVEQADNLVITNKGKEVLRVGKK